MSRCGPGPVCLPAKWLHVFFYFFLPPSMHAMQPNREMEACFLSNLWLTVDAKWKEDCWACFRLTGLFILLVHSCKHVLFFACNLTAQNSERSCCTFDWIHVIYNIVLLSACFAWFLITCLYCMNEKFLHAHMFPFACGTHLSRWHSRACGIVDSVWALWCSFALGVRRSWLEPVFSHTMCKEPAGGPMRLELYCDINQCTTTSQPLHNSTLFCLSPWYASCQGF